MLTAFQCEVVAYIGNGDTYCPECAVDAGYELSDGILRFSLDEMQSERNRAARAYSDVISTYFPNFPDCTEDCEPEVEVCGRCGAQLGEPHHYGHQDDES